MNSVSSLALAVAVLAFVAGCSIVDGRADVPRPSAPLEGSFDPPASPVAEQATRFYVDDNGRIWDDRGRRHDARS